MNQSPAPVAGAVEALAIAREALSRLAEPMQPPSSVMSIARLRISIATDALARFDAALAKPAPAVAVEAEREALIERLQTLEDPQRSTQSDWDNLDWRTLAGTCWRALAARTAPAVAESQWMPIETAPRDPCKRILLRWLSGGSNWICIGSWASAEDSPRLVVKGCPREGWMPDAGTCIPRNQKDCVGWMPLPAVGSGSAQEGQAK